MKKIFILKYYFYNRKFSHFICQHAPSLTIIYTTILSFLQVIALICGLIVIVLMLMALTSTDWLLSAGWRQGLFSHCIAVNAPTPLPFNVPNYGPECYPTREVGTCFTRVNVTVGNFSYSLVFVFCIRIHKSGCSVVHSHFGHRHSGHTSDGTRFEKQRSTNQVQVLQSGRLRHVTCAYVTPYLAL